MEPESFRICDDGYACLAPDCSCTNRPKFEAGNLSAKETGGAGRSRQPVPESLAPPQCPIPEGQECPTCMRRVPRKAKPTSPKTKVLSIRIPIDDAERFAEILAAAAKHDGQYEKPHWMYWTVLRGLVRTLQDVPETDG